MAVMQVLQEENLPTDLPVLSTLDAQLALLLCSKSKLPVPTGDADDIERIRLAVMEPRAAETLLILSRIRRILDVIEMPVVQFDNPKTADITHTLVLHAVALALLAIDGGKYGPIAPALKPEWKEIGEVLGMTRLRKSCSKNNLQDKEAGKTVVTAGADAERVGGAVLGGGDRISLGDELCNVIGNGEGQT